MKGYLCELDVDIFYDYQPYESATRTYPGADASIDVGAVELSATDSNGKTITVDLWPVLEHMKEVRESIEEQCWSDVDGEDDGYGDWLYDQMKDRKLEASDA